jgi:hypothetical protein
MKKYERLLAGQTIISKEPGNSMLPKIKSMQPVKLAPCTWKEVKIGDIVYCKVRGKLYTHIVGAICPKRGCRIENNRGRVNGWTKKVYGKVTEIL